MDKKRYLEESKRFVGYGFGYLHSEMENGKAPQLVMSGETFSVMWQVCGIINRISEIMGLTFNETFRMTYALSQTGYEEVKIMTKNQPMKVYVGENYDEQWRKEKEKEIRRENATESVSLAISLAEMEKCNTSLNNQLVEEKKKHSKELRAKDDEIKKLNKMVLELEHRMKEMEEKRLFGHEEHQ